MGFFDRLKSVFAPKRITSSEEAILFLESRAAFVAQKSLTEYTQARANMMFSSLQREKGFQAACEDARWRSFPVTLSMVAEVMGGALRTRLGSDALVASKLIEDWVTQVIDKMKGHGPLSDADWQVARESASRDLARAALGEPHTAHVIARARAKEVFNALPFHAAIRQHDFDMFSNTIAFHLTEIATELEQTKLEKTVLSTPLA
jgi:hypothetical protein